MSDKGYPTSLGTSTADEIRLMGQNLTAEIMGQVSFTELAYRLVTLRQPTPGQVRMLDTVLASLADHGFTPTAMSARLTYLSAPDSLQGAVAAGILGGGSRFLGVTEDSGAFLAATLAEESALPVDAAGWDALAERIIRRQREKGEFVPGVGHPVHKVEDPRVPVIYRVAEETGTLGPHLTLFAAIGRMTPVVLGKQLPLNGAGVAGAALADIDIPIPMLRGFALLARTAGVLGHIAEEQRRPIGMDIYMEVDRNAVYVDPRQ